ncbi:MAG: hypothetical protein SPL56_00945, partial [Lachnospiraceae bacterium]|nr:hypothetical protein [Lachnospiraceae bacterium]
ISGALGAMLDLGHGSGPMNHAFDQHGRFMEEAPAASEAGTAASKTGTADRNDAAKPQKGGRA